MTIFENFLTDLSLCDNLVPKEDIMSFYGLKNSNEELTDSEVRSSFIGEIKSMPFLKAGFNYQADMVPVVMSESSDNGIRYYIEYNDLKKYSMHQGNNISTAFMNVCDANNIHYENTVVFFKYDVFSEAIDIAKKIKENNNLNYKLYNKLSISDFYNDLVSLKESEISMITKKHSMEV